MDNTAYKCPNCGGNLIFDSNSRKLKCEQCDSLFDPDYLGEESLVFQNEEEIREDESTGELTVHVFKCDSCGGELAATEQTAATRCPYCGSPNIIFDRISRDLRPDVVIPFAIDREKVEEIFWKKIKKHKFIPRDLRKRSSVEKLTASYVPYWLYDGKAVIDAQCHATRVHYSHDDNYDYTHTDHFEVVRKIEAEYQNVSWDASREMEDARMQKLEPFQMNDLKPFEPGYLLGYQAERYDVSREEAEPLLKEKVKKFLMQEVRSSVTGYATVDIRKHTEELYWSKQRYAMFPVWNYHYQFAGKEYEFLINGQTGKFVGKLPKSAASFFWWLAVFFAVIMLIFMVTTDWKGADVSQNIHPENVEGFSVDGENHLMTRQDTYIDRQRTNDFADLLTEEEEESLEQQLDTLSETYLTDFVALTVEDTNGYDTATYAENFIDYNAYGFGEGYDSVQIMVDMQHREIWITGTGLGQFYITSSRANDIYEDISYLATGGDYAKMFMQGFHEIEQYFKNHDISTSKVSFYSLDLNTRRMLEHQGRAFSMKLFYWLTHALISVFLAFAITGIWCIVDNSTYGAEAVSEDFRKNKKILHQRDQFINTTTTKTSRASSSGGGGGHYGGSGRSHSGGGGHF